LEIKSEVQKIISNDNEYEKYVNLFREYFKIKDDESKLKIKFEEIISTYHELKRKGVI